MKKSQIFLFLLLSFILGTALASFTAVSFFISFCILMAGLTILVIAWPKFAEVRPQSKKRLGLISAISLKRPSLISILTLFGLCLIVLVLGILRYNASLPKISSEKIQFYNSQEVVFQGVVCSEPDIRIDKTKLTISSQKLFLRGEAKDISGKVLLTTGLYPEYYYGDQLEVNCRLEEPEWFNDFDYSGYLARYDIYSLCYWPKIKVIAHNQGNSLYEAILSLKSKLQNLINSHLSEPQASLVSAVILGNKRGLSEDFQEKLNITGTRHLTAVSGLHITILAMLFMNFLLLFVRRQYAFYFAIFSLVLYIILIGAPASAIRAGIMVFLLLLAQRLGRLRQSANAVVLAAVLMLLVNPKLLTSDVGFQLSFAAVLGIIWFYPYLQEKLSKLPKKLAIRDSVAVTLAAQIFAFPLIWYHFGRLSLLSPLSNVLILPIMPFLLASGFLFFLPTLVFSILSKVLVWPVWLLASYVVGLVKLLAKIPFAQITAGNAPWWFIGFLYMLIGWWVWKINRSDLLNLKKP